MRRPPVHPRFGLCLATHGSEDDGEVECELWGEGVGEPCGLADELALLVTQGPHTTTRRLHALLTTQTQHKIERITL